MSSEETTPEESTASKSQGRVEKENVASEMKRSFLEYSMSVIVSRALPDVRDGLKPVHRRILYSLNEQHIRPTGPFKKCARVVGDVMGKYHPHGDSAIYDALVRLAQSWSMGLTLVDGHGNFGSLDDGPAAARYTECRMDAAGAALLDGIDEETVDFRDNYDGTEQEPSVLPAAFPNLLINGGTGIAVGMATNIPPHNLGEVAAGLKAMIDDPKISLADLMAHIPGPDFPTGGIVIGAEGITDAYTGGRGSFQIRATAEITDITPRKKGIVITELPFAVGPERVIAKIRDLIRDKKLTGISDVTDLSDRKTGLRLVIEVKNGFRPEAVLAELYRLTPLQESFGVNAVALVDGRPATLGLREMCSHFLAHRIDVVRRRTENRKAKAESRLHIVDGLLKALDAIDEVVSIIRGSKSVDTAREKLRKLLGLDAAQIAHILDMPLRRLTGLEVTKLKDEAKDLRASIRDLNKILKSKASLNAVIAEELDEVVVKHGVERRTKLVGSASDDPVTAAVASAGDTLLEIADEPCTVTLSTNGLIGRIPADPAATRAKRTAADQVRSSVTTSTRSKVGVLTADGVLHRVDVVDLPVAEARSRGASVSEFADVNGSEPVAVVPFEGAEGTGIALGTCRGVVKRVAYSDFATRNRSASIIGLSDGDQVVGAQGCTDADRMVFVTSDARLLAIPAEKTRQQGRGAGGVGGVKLNEGAVVVVFAVAAADGDSMLVTISDAGRAKATPVTEYPAKGRGGGGVRCMRFLSDENQLASAWIGIGDYLLVSDSASELGALATGKRDGSGDKGEGTWTTVTGAKPRG
ncbi:MAG: DNA topoisomerase 4 subunit A [Actinomycetia bacterium]|nr:DNA topoisomerase 4 subunit A [Actinomycetes bacterium]MCP4845028.1 DNA topoisomerase 4 subunit A [Actinomycetes bacterium]